MQITRRGLLVTAAALSASTLLPRFANAETPTLNYGGSTWIGHYPAYSGIERGTFTKYGVDLKWQQFAGSAAALTGLMADGVDVASVGFVSACALMSRGSDRLQIIGSPNVIAGASALFVRPDVKSIHDLAGKKVGVTFASTSHLLILDLLDQAGMNAETDVSIINVSPPETVVAYSSKQIDAVVAWHPQYGKIAAMPETKILVSDEEFSLFKEYGLAPGPDILVARRARAESAPVDVTNFLKGFFESSDLMRENPQDATKYLSGLSTITGQSAADQVKLIESARWNTFAEQQDYMRSGSKLREGLQKFADLLAKYKQIDSVPQIDNWVTDEYLKA